VFDPSFAVCCSLLKLAIRNPRISGHEISPSGA
jgi:hypothetical protein